MKLILIPLIGLFYSFTFNNSGEAVFNDKIVPINIANFTCEGNSPQDLLNITPHDHYNQIGHLSHYRSFYAIEKTDYSL